MLLASSGTRSSRARAPASLCSKFYLNSVLGFFLSPLCDALFGIKFISKRTNKKNSPLEKHGAEFRVFRVVRHCTGCSCHLPFAKTESSTFFIVAAPTEMPKTLLRAINIYFRLIHISQTYFFRPRLFCSDAADMN